MTDAIELDTAWMPVISAEERQRVLSLTPKEREDELSNWLKQHNLNHSMKMDIGTGFCKLELYGVNIVRHILAGKEDSSKPFGSSGFCSFNTITYAMCNLSHGSRIVAERLYDGYTRHIENYLIEDVVPFLADKRDYVLLKEFSDVWNSHKVLTNWMYKLFNQIDRTHVGLRKGKKSITSCALNCFYRIVFHDVKERVRTCVLHFIDLERCGTSIERDQLKSCVQMFELMGMAANVSDVKSIIEASKLPTDISIYLTELEQPLLDNTAEYYSRQRTKWLGQSDMLAYYALVEEAVRAEEQRVQVYLNPNTLPRLLGVTLQELMIVPAERVKESFHDILRSADNSIQFDNAAFPDTFCTHMKTIFFILMQIRQLPAATGSSDSVTVFNSHDDLMNIFVSKFREYLLEWAGKILAVRSSYYIGASESITSGEDEKRQVAPLTGSAKTAADLEYVKNCLKFYARANMLVTNCFQSYSQMKVCIHDALVILMNEEINTASGVVESGISSTSRVSATEMLVTYLDKCLKKDNKDQAAASDAEMDSVLNDSLILFRSIRDKDVFIELYKDALGKRMLNNKSASMEEEKNLIGKLKVVQGANFTCKVEGMLVDMGTSEAANKEFHTHTKGAYSEFSAQVLSSNWRLPSANSVVVPPLMQSWLDVYASYYLSGRPRMVLTWLYKVGEATVKFALGSRSFELVMLPIQAVVLLQFDRRSCGETTSLSFGEIAELTGVKEVEILKRVLHSFSCPNKIIKTPLLCKYPNVSKHISEKDRFSVNAAFSSKLRRVTVPVGSMDIDTSNSRSVEASVEESRKFVLQACVVRIMKARKLLSHVELTAEVMRQINSFVPQVKAIKATIESLIEREYLERDGKNYKYLA